MGLDILEDMIEELDMYDLLAVTEVTRVATIICKNQKNKWEFVSHLYIDDVGSYHLYLDICGIRRVLTEEERLYHAYFNSRFGKKMYNLKEEYTKTKKAKTFVFEVFSSLEAERDDDI